MGQTQEDITRAALQTEQWMIPDFINLAWKTGFSEDQEKKSTYRRRTPPEQTRYCQLFRCVIGEHGERTQCHGGGRGGAEAGEVDLGGCLRGG